MGSILTYFKKLFSVKKKNNKEWRPIQHETGRKGDDMYVRGTTPNWLNKKIKKIESRKILRNTKKDYFFKSKHCTYKVQVTCDKDECHRTQVYYKKK
jgi:hypothetical protein